MPVVRAARVVLWNQTVIVKRLPANASVSQRTERVRHGAVYYSDEFDRLAGANETPIALARYMQVGFFIPRAMPR
jgi:hypothetical protein